MIRAVVFDLDGVLVDAVEWHFQAFARALALFGYPITREEHQTAYNGLPTKLKLEIMSQRTHLPRSLHPFLNELKQRYTREFLERELRPSNALKAMLSHLKRDGLKIAVATNSTRHSLDLILAGLEIAPLFDVAISHEEVASPKPDPAVYHETLRRLGVRADEVLVVEDSLAGIAAARQATSNVMVVKNPSEVTYERISGEVHRANELMAIASSGEVERKPRIEIVIPMAGEGSRFREKGYPEPKPLIPIFGRPMVDWVVENLRPAEAPHRFTFLCRKGHLENTPLAANLKWLCPDGQVLQVPETTQGAACTVLLATEKLDLTQPLVVANVDQWLGTSLDPFFAYAQSSGVDGLILTFPAQETKWSYARTDEGRRVTEVAEKKVISEHATVGIYYFRQGSLFVDAAQQMIRNEVRTNGEFYLCPVFNELVRAGKRVEIFPIPAYHMHGLGTPEDLEQFVRWSLSAHPTPQNLRTLSK